MVAAEASKQRVGLVNIRHPYFCSIINYIAYANITNGSENIGAYAISIPMDVAVLAINFQAMSHSFKLSLPCLAGGESLGKFITISSRRRG